jgi:hypothetical protein
MEGNFSRGQVYAKIKLVVFGLGIVWGAGNSSMFKKIHLLMSLRIIWTASGAAL